MNKRIVLISVVVVALIVGGFGYLFLTSSRSENAENQSSEQTSSTTTEPAATKSEPAAEPTAQTAPQPGTYTDYSEAAVQTTAGTKLVFFHAPWCPQCRALEASIKSQGVPSGVTIFKTDYDSSQALRQKYGVTIQTTVVKVDDNGNLVAKFVAYDDPSIDAVTKELL